MKQTEDSITISIDEAVLFTNGKHWYYLVVGRDGFELAKPMDVTKGFKSREEALRSIRDHWCLGWRKTEVVSMRPEEVTIDDLCPYHDLGNEWGACECDKEKKVGEP